MKEETIGLEEMYTYAFGCGDCHADLVEVVVTETNEARQARGLQPLKQKFKVVKCYKCGGSSFETPVFEGSAVAGAAKNGIELDVSDTDVLEDGTVFTYLTTRRLK